ncbi:MAG: hypothetical protein KJO22_00955 [Bacteroidia bacterium]|nr:hypothetical protein [Bacteroidia bacterium]
MINRANIVYSRFFNDLTLQDEAEASIQRDSSQIDIRYFEDNIVDRYPGDEFNYSINDTGGVNLIQRALSKFFKWLSDVFGFDIDFIDYQILEYIIYGILSLIVIYVIVRYLKDTSVNKMLRSEVTDIENFSFTETTIDTVNFNALVSQALKEDNYRLATRYLYLKTLKELSNQDIIDWHFDKTNSDYVKEINDDTIKQLFKRISYIYDYIWYGEFPIDKQSFDKNMLTFNSILKQTANG